MNDGISGMWHAFDAMSARDVHDLLKLRQDVFMLEQNCLFHEIDGQDPEALHYLMRRHDNGLLIGAVRLFEANAARGFARIGRVVISQQARGLGLGGELMQAAITEARRRAPRCRIDVSAQAHLEKFYRGLGFETVSAIYLEDDIPHIDMVLR